MKSLKHKTIIIGGGIIGLSTLWFLTNYANEKDIILLEKNTVGSGCSEKAAGMLTPINEIEFDEVSIVNAGIESLNLYEQWKKDAPFIPISNKKGSYEIALTEDDNAYLKRRLEFQKKYGFNVQWIDDVAEKLDIPINPNVKSAIFAPEETQLDAQKFLKLLKQNLNNFIKENHSLVSFQQQKNKIIGQIKNEITEKVINFETENLILATGVNNNPEWNLPIKIIPIRGQIVGVKQIPQIFDMKENIIRIFSKELGKGYIVGKENRIILGTTSEMKGLQEITTVGGIFNILRRSFFTFPGIDELPIIKINAGLRPATKSFLPVIDKIPGTNIIIANGFYRHGFLLAPLAAQTIMELLNKKPRNPWVRNWKI